MLFEPLFADNIGCPVCPWTKNMINMDLMRKRFARENNLLKKPSKPFKLEMIPEDMQSMILTKNFQEDDIDDSMTSTIDFQRESSSRDSKYCNKDVKLYLKAVKIDKWLQKELTGVIKLKEFSIDYYRLVVEAYWMNFLMSRMIESVSLDLSSVSPQLINCCLQTLRPEKLEFKAEEEIVELGENLKEVKRLFVTRTRVNWNYSSLQKLEELIVSDPYDMPGSFDVIKILEMWCLGESNLREMTYSLCHGASKTALHTLNGEEVTDFYAGWLVNRGALQKMVLAAFHQDRNMTRGDPPEAYMLTQNASKKTAACVYYKDHVFFKTKEIDDQESGNRWL